MVEDEKVVAWTDLKKIQGFSLGSVSPLQIWS